MSTSKSLLQCQPTFTSNPRPNAPVVDLHPAFIIAAVVAARPGPTAHRRPLSTATRRWQLQPLQHLPPVDDDRCCHPWRWHINHHLRSPCCSSRSCSAHELYFPAAVELQRSICWCGWFDGRSCMLPRWGSYILSTTISLAEVPTHARPCDSTFLSLSCCCSNCCDCCCLLQVQPLCALMARMLVLSALILLSTTEAAGAAQKSDIQEWPFPAVSESWSRPCNFGWCSHTRCQPVAGVPGRPLGRTSGCMSNGAIFQLYRRKKASTPVTIARRYAAVAPQAGAAITRGAAAPGRAKKCVISAHWCT